MKNAVDCKAIGVLPDLRRNHGRCFGGFDPQTPNLGRWPSRYGRIRHCAPACRRERRDFDGRTQRT
ncbi:protein of unknown function [Methylocella tundrae]|uniref:Uncharacterized protein n=1 Tax=Methylocella tundrae TaxID=227605 RepID=A0A4U8YUM6_METTU|nr:protein of unknown function [Methylocella tundrae]